MRLVKFLSILFLPSILLAVVPTNVKNDEAKVQAEEIVEAKLSENLKVSNPFVPYKTGGAANLEAMDSSDFEFYSFVTYLDHQEFSLKEKGSDKVFWLSSKGEDEGLNYGLKFQNFYTEDCDHYLIVQDIASGTRIKMKQKEPNMSTSNAVGTMNPYGDSSDFFKMLAAMGDDDEDEVLPLKKGAK